MRSAAFAVLGLFLNSCAGLPELPPRPQFKGHAGIRDSADALQTYYHYRLTREAGGYAYGRLHIAASQIPAFMDHQGDTVAARWARQGRALRWSGWGLAAALEASAMAIAMQAGERDPARQAGWAALLPAALLGWTFHWIADGWFLKPAVAHYDLQLKRELGLTTD